MITVTAFAWVPPFARGQVRDLRVRWALEEAGLPYRTRLLEPGEGDTDAYRALQPFGQVPVYEEDGLVLFETGAIVHHIARCSAALMPDDDAGAARTVQWLFAALNSIEPHVMTYATLDVFHAGEDWARLRKPSADAFLRKRLGGLSRALGEKDWLDGGRFTAGDLMMGSVLRIIDVAAFMPEAPNLGAYVARCEARPAFARALAAQLGDFRDAA